MPKKPRDQRYQLWGWYVFVGSAFFFIGASLRNGDWLSLLASVLFLVGCILFLVPLHMPPEE